MNKCIVKSVLAASGILAGMLLFAPGNAVAASYQYARVLSAEPVYATQRTPIDREVCWEEQHYEQVGGHHSHTPMILGAIIGGVVGNQFGGGSGKKALTAAGAVLGGSVGHDTAVRNRQGASYRPVVSERCTIQRDYRSENVITGYNVTYEYDGQVYHTRTDYHPGDRIQVRVAVTPVR